MKQQLNPEQIRQLLNRSANHLDEPVLARLREARTHALERHATQHAHAWAFSTHGHWRDAVSHHKPAMWLAGILLVAGILSGVAYWQQATDNDPSDDDIAILTDEMPIQAFVD